MIEQISTVDIDFTPAIQGSEKTERTLNDLRKEIKKLKDALGDTVIESDDFGKTLELLNEKQKELKEVTKLTKKSVDALDGSYNALSQQMTELRKQWKATNNEVERDELGQQINEINNQLKELDKTTGNYQRNVGNYTGGIIDAFAQLKQELKDTKNEILQVEEGTDEYFEKVKKAAEISQKLQDVNEFIKSSANDLGDHLENLTGAFAGVTGSIQMVQGAMNLVGVESEQIEKAIAKLQGLMAITDGLKAIEGAIDPFKRLTTSIKLATAGMSGFKKALIGTGIGAVVVLLGTLIAHWDDVSKALGFANTKQAEANRLLEEQKTRLDDLNSALDDRLKKMQLYGDASQKELEQEKLRTYKDELVQVEKLISTYEGWMNAGKKLNKQQKESYENALAQQKALKGNILDTELALKNIADKEKEDANKQIQTTEQERIRTLKESQQKEIELFALGIEEKKILQGEEWTATYEYIEQMKTLFDMKKQLYADDEVALKQVMNEELAFLKENLPEQVKEIENVITGLDTGSEKPTPALLQKVIPNKEQLEETKSGWDNFTENLSSSWSDFVTEFDKMSLQERVSFVTNQIGQVGNSINGLLNSLTEGMDENEKEYKDNQIAQIVISTITGVAQAIASAWQLGPIMGAIVGPINAASTLASGITAIKKLQSNSPTLDGLGTFNSPASNPTQASKTALESLSQGINYTNLVEGASTSSKIKDTKVYVTETDIRSTMNKVSVTESESVF